MDRRAENVWWQKERDCQKNCPKSREAVLYEIVLMGCSPRCTNHNCAKNCSTALPGEVTAFPDKVDKRKH